MTTETNMWVVPDAMIPALSTAGHTSHESICVLNASPLDARVIVEAYFADRNPAISSPIAVPAGRSAHLRTDSPDAVGGLEIPRGVPYGLVVRSEDQVHVQYSRLDTTQPAYALMTVLPVGGAR